MAIFNRAEKVEVALAEQAERFEVQLRELRAALARLQEENAGLQMQVAEQQAELARVVEQSRLAVRKARWSAKNSKERAGRYKARLLKLAGKESVV